MDRDISKLEPQIVWGFFHQLTKIPRPSGKEEKVLQYLIETARELGLDYTVTPIGNIVIRKKATSLDIHRQKIALQAHMDMVPSKTKESQHNFATDPIDAYIDGEWVTANQTTLGADNGMGVAMALAVLASDNIKHNDLEVLITTDEEAGMTGAFGITGNELNSEVLINLDSEEDHEVCIGCAGGINTNITYNFNKEVAKPERITLKIELKDLFSGHSGVDIPLGRANAIKEIAHLLLQIGKISDYDLVSISGGRLRNVIPSYCEAYISINHNDLQKVLTFLEEYAKNLIDEFKLTDPNLKLTATITESAPKIISSQNAYPFVFALASVFNGVWRMNNALNIAETSSNIGVVTTHDDHFSVITLQRSALSSAKIKIANSVAAAFEQIGAQIEHSDNYPGWQPNIQSPSLAKVKEVYKKLFNEEIHVSATHGGLECGLILDKFPQIDAISIGATIRYPHSPNEKVNIKSVAKTWKLLTNLIESI